MLTRAAHAAELVEILDGVFATKTRPEWAKLFKENGVIFAPVNLLDDLEFDCQMVANEYITEYEHPAWGKVKEIGFPVSFSETPMKITREAPQFGQHKEEVLTEVLGYGWDEINKLKDEEVI